MKNTGAVYEVRTYGSVRGMRHEPHPTRYVQDLRSLPFSDILSFKSLVHPCTSFLLQTNHNSPLPWRQCHDHVDVKG